ncbi:DNA-binding transcriptional MocR family regulator [Chitinivorax tropicus]|uniref:DNA-binding transcriptional MocR family regulator n=1 Tax=Chitinivorax tropicus TaxID=714531 RepID=A0A840ML76_9PROT|nr:PLP-dependent aminotransferase family protein [Chitinivorax tropicus]MBB5017889.1 DNA-binding transcriptional MocR family regulator [Chitinivorax tropicus]
MTVEKSGLLYESLASEIAGMIASGAMKSGDKLPSIRKLSSQRDVSLSTVIQAFRVLEDRGLIEARPQAGFYVRRPAIHWREPAITQPAATPCEVEIDELRWQILYLSQRGEGAALGCAAIDPDLFPNQTLQRILSSTARRHARMIGSYAFPPGNAQLRRQIARRSFEWGGLLRPDDLVITNGCIEALYLCLQAVTRPGDVVAIESPAYFGLLQQLESFKLKALEIPTHPVTGISLDALEMAMRTSDVKAVVVVANFSNPLGSLMPEENKRKLVELLAERDIPLIEDDIYGDFHFSDQRPRPAKAFDTTGNVLYCSSFNKVLAPGFRVGWVAPGRYYATVQNLKMISSMSTPELLQLTLAQFVESGGYDHHLRKLRRSVEGQLHKYADTILRYFPSGARLTVPQGGYVLWIEFPRGFDSVALLRRSIVEDIPFAPGVLFSASQDAYGHCMRINCGLRWSAKVEAALQRLGDLAKEQLALQQIPH